MEKKGDPVRGERLRQIRKGLGLTQDQLADRMTNEHGKPYSKSMVAHVENAYSNGGRHFWVEVSKALGVSLAKLLGGGPSARTISVDGVVRDDGEVEVLPGARRTLSSWADLDDDGTDSGVEWVAVPEAEEDWFALRTEWNRRPNDTELRAGDLLVMSPSSAPRHGAIVLAVRGSEAPRLMRVEEVFARGSDEPLVQLWTLWGQATGVRGATVLGVAVGLWRTIEPKVT